MFKLTVINTFDPVKAHAILTANGRRYALPRAAEFFEAQATANAPVDTGAYKASIRVVPGPDDSFRVVATVPYATFVEWGSFNVRANRRIPPNPVFRMAAVATRAAFPGIRVIVTAGPASRTGFINSG